MPWVIFQILISAGIIVFFTRVLIFLINTYPWRWALGIFTVLILAFQALGKLAFPYSQSLYESRMAYLLQNHLILIALPILFSVVLTHLICLRLLRGRSIHYHCEGGTLFLFENGEQTSIQPHEIISIATSIHPAPTHWMNPLKLFRLNTKKGIFWFDEALEKSYLLDAKKTSFLSLKAGKAQVDRNSNFYLGNARATSYFRNNLI